MKRILHNFLPTLTLLTFLLLWELGVRWANIPAYTLPTPSVIAMSLIDHWPSLALSWWFTIKITLGALLLACLGGVLIASVFSLSPQI